MIWFSHNFMKLLIAILIALPLSGVLALQLTKQERDNSPPSALSTAELAELGDPLFRHVLRDDPSVSKLSVIAQKLRGNGNASPQLFVVDEKIISAVRPSGRRAVISYAGTGASGQALNGTVMLSFSFSSESWEDEPRSFEAWGWDAIRGRYNYYKREGNPQTWRFRGHSLDVDLKTTQQRQGTCMRCHVNGAPIMKELLIPWNNWRSFENTGETAYLKPGKNNSWPVAATDEMESMLTGAETLEGQIINAITRFNKARVAAWLRSDPNGTPTFVSLDGKRTGTVLQARRLLRPLFETTEVQLVASRSLSGRHPLEPKSDDLPGDVLRSLPVNFFLNATLLRGGLTPSYRGLGISQATDFPGKLSLQRGEYRSFVDNSNMKFGGQSGDAHSAFMIPEPSHVDNDLIDQAMKAGAVSPHFVAATLGVDWQTPVFSTRREKLARFIPDTYTFIDPTDGPTLQNEALTKKVIEALQAANVPSGSPEEEWLANLKSPDAVQLLRTRIQERLTQLESEMSPSNASKRSRNIQILLQRMISVRKAMLNHPQLKNLDETGDGRLLPVP
jgi:hypothetical protein